jgi:uncharacterized protein (TIGR03086 family)
VDLVELYRRGLGEFADRVGQVRPDQWTGPTPCYDWDVRALVNHLVYEERWSVPLFAGATIAQVGDRFEGDLLGADPVGTALDAAKQAEQAVAEPDALERIVHLSFGDVPAQEYARQLLADHLVHAWDLAVAIGADPRLDPEAVQACARWFVEREDLYRQGGMIAPRVQVAADRPEQDRLIGAFGRDPDWAPPGQ